MITVISGTNRSGNISIRVANAIHELLTSNDIEAQVLDLQKLPLDFVFRNDVYGNPDPGFSAISEQFIETADKFLFVIPEYNGSYPGVCKAFIDSVWPEYFHDKKAGIIGIASGRAGNVRGCDQLTNVLNYLRVTVHPMKINLIHVDSMIDEEGGFSHDASLGKIQRLLSGLIAF